MERRSVSLLEPAPHLEFTRANIVRVFRKHLDLKLFRIFLFGSEAAGTAKPRSDIDIGIDGPHAVPAETLAKIRDELDELRTLRKFDLVDFKETSEPFREIAGETVVPLGE